MSSAMGTRRHEANADDLSRMAWLAIHLGNESMARQYVEEGLGMDLYNSHITKLAQRLGLVF